MSLKLLWGGVGWDAVLCSPTAMQTGPSSCPPGRDRAQQMWKIPYTVNNSWKHQIFLGKKRHLVYWCTAVWMFNITILMKNKWERHLCNY